MNVGKAWEVAGVNVKPSVGVRYHHLTAARYSLPGVNVSTDTADVFSMQAGISLDKTFEFNGVTVKPEIGSYVVEASHGKLRTNVNDQRLVQEIGRYTKQEEGVSLNYRNVGIGLHGGVMSGNALNKQRFVSFKASYEW